MKSNKNAICFVNNVQLSTAGSAKIEEKRRKKVEKSQPKD